MTTEELAAAVTALPGMPPLERERAARELAGSCRAVIAAQRASAMRELMQERRLSQGGLALLLGISPKQVSDAVGERQGPGRRGRPARG